MTQMGTESLHLAAAGLDALEGGAALRHLLRAQLAAAAAVEAALPDIDRGAALMAETLRAGGHLVYAGAGSSALMAISDGLELSGTFGVSSRRILLRMAGGLPVDAQMPGDTEDDDTEGAKAGAALLTGDLVIAVTASGRTPYSLALAKAARLRGARVVAIANNPGAAIFAHADVAICLPTPPEVIAGSTRMGAATAQKIALNMMSTLMGIRLGQVHDGMMVGLIADNEKLRVRARAMVAPIAGVGDAEASASLAAAGGAVKPAVLIARGVTPQAAERLLTATEGNLRAALARLTTTGPAPIFKAGQTDKTNQGSTT